MSGKILVLNSGSSSIKYRLFNMTDSKELASGAVEQVGERQGRFHHQAIGHSDEVVQEQPIPSHQEGMNCIAAALKGLLAEGLAGIGHRVVHGGEAFREPTRIDAGVLQAIRAQVPLAPLHNPANITGIEVALARWPGVPQVAVFDTTFHHTLPPHAYHYPLPSDLCKQHSIRRYGFHGTSHQYVARQAARFLQKPLDSLHLITLHLGNGASAAAIRRGQCIDTSMGMTPLEGLMMGTRSGDIDPAILLYLKSVAGLTDEKLDDLLNKESGLKGICGVNDMREVLAHAEQGDDRASLAVKMYCHRIKKYVGAYMAILSRLDALVFTAGIGEHAARIRADVCHELDHLGITIDNDRNRANGSDPRAIHEDGSPVQVLVIPTNEELAIAMQTVEVIQA